MSCSSYYDKVDNETGETIVNTGLRELCHSVKDRNKEAYLEAAEMLARIVDKYSLEGYTFVPPSIKDNYSGLFSSKLQPVLTAIKNGNDINEKSTDDSKPYYGYTPIEWSMENNRFDISDALLKAGAELTPNVFWKGIIDFKPASTLQMYLMHGLADAVGIYELLDYVLKNGSVDHLKVLLKLKPDLNKKLPSGLTPIQTEKANKYFPGGRSSVIKLLVKYGAKAR